MKVSVIIPVFNATAYVEQAVHSALEQCETGEVLLIEDGSPDKESLSICNRLASADARVRLFQHPGGKNRGAGPSRNLGLVNASCDYIAFLDADDFYLPNRFAETQKVFERDPAVEAVYECAGTFFETEQAKRIWQSQGRPAVTCIEPGIPPEKVFESMYPIGKRGKCSLIGMTLKRSVIDRIGLLPSLDVGQDTVFEMKVAAGVRWVAGQLSDPVVMRRVHSANRTTGCSVIGVSWAQSGIAYWRGRMRIYMEIVRWLKTQAEHESKLNLVLGAVRRDSKRVTASKNRSRLGSFFQLGCFFVELVGRNPPLLKHSMFVKGFLRDIYYCLRK